MNPKYIKKCMKIIGEHNKLHENVIALGMNQSKRFNLKG
jgi:hypothetical protein